MWFFIFAFAFPLVAADQPYARCTIVSNHVNASAEMVFPNLDSIFNASMLYEYFRIFETKMLQRLSELQSNICNFNLQSDGSPAFETSRLRTTEVEKFNATVHTEKHGRVFTYYWRLEHLIASSLRRQRAPIFRSPSFYVYSQGYRMYLKFLTEYDGNALQVQVGITSGRYDDQLPWPFTLKYRVSVLDQSHAPDVTDIVSKVWNPQTVCEKWVWLKPTKDNPGCSGLTFSADELLSGRYLKNNHLTIKLTVFV